MDSESRSPVVINGSVVCGVSRENTFIGCFLIQTGAVGDTYLS